MINDAEPLKPCGEECNPNQRAHDTEETVGAQNRVPEGPLSLADTQLREEIVADVLRLQGVQNEYNGFIMEMFRKEAEQGEYTASLVRTVLHDEAELLATNSNYLRWNASGGVRRCNEKALERWFDNEELLDLTDYAAFVPFPRNPSTQRDEMVREAVDELGLNQQFFVTNYADRPKNSRAKPCLIACRNGTDAVVAAHALKDTLEHSPCLFLEFPYSERVQRNSVCLRFFVAKGVPIAAERAYDGTSVPQFCRTHEFSQALGTWVNQKVLPHFPERTFCGIVRCSLPTPASPCFHLLHLGALEPQDYTHFTWTDMVGVIVSQTQAGSSKDSERPCFHLRLPAAHADANSHGITTLQLLAGGVAAAAVGLMAMKMQKQ